MNALPGTIFLLFINGQFQFIFYVCKRVRAIDTTP